MLTNKKFRKKAYKSGIPAKLINAPAKQIASKCLIYVLYQIS